VKYHPQLWPTPQDYNETVQNPHICFEDSDLRTGKVEITPIGLPRAASGTFASVYKVKSPGRAWAVRCFLSNRTDQEERYKHISEFVLFDKLDCTVAFHYLPKGIKVGTTWYPIVKMPWIEGPTLENYLFSIYRDKEKLSALTRDFYNLTVQLENAGIAHGDLQHGNIIVSPDGLRLVDYDAFFVPKLLGKRNLEYGHPNYQHPLRDDFHFDVSVDNFSSWLIHLSLTALMHDPALFTEFGGGDDCILFKRADLIEPESSELFMKLDSHRSSEVRNLSQRLKGMLWVLPHLVPPLDASEEELAHLPREKPASWALSMPAQDFSLEDNSAAISSASTASKQRRASLKPKLRGLKQLAESAFHNVTKQASPRYFITLRTLDGRDHLNKGRYNEALKCFSQARDLHATVFPAEQEQSMALLLRLALCSNYLDARSNNYCLLAAQTAKEYAREQEENLAIHTKGSKLKLRLQANADLDHEAYTMRLLAKFYKSLSDFLYYTSRRNSNQEFTMSKMFIALMENCVDTINKPEISIVMLPLMQFVLSLIETERFIGSQSSLADASRKMLWYSGLWHVSNSWSKKQVDYEAYWSIQCHLMRALGTRSGETSLILRAEILSRVDGSVHKADLAFIELCNSNREAFKTALLECCKQMKPDDALGGLSFSLSVLKKKDPVKYDEIVLWLWDEVVSTKPVTPFVQLHWLNQFDKKIIEKCLNDEAKEAIIDALRSNVRAFNYNYFNELVGLVRKIDRDHRSFTHRLVSTLAQQTRIDALELTEEQIESIKIFVRRYASDDSDLQFFAATFKKSHPNVRRIRGEKS